jgi:hypothetical protein
MSSVLIVSCGGGGSSSSDDLLPKGNQTGSPISGLYLLVRGYSEDAINTQSEMTNGAGIMVDGRFAGVFKGHSFIVYTLTGDRTRLFADTRLYDGEGGFSRTLSSLGYSVFTELNSDNYGEQMQIITEGYDLVNKISINQGFSIDTAATYTNITELQQPFLNLVGTWIAEDGSSSFIINSDGDLAGTDQQGCQWAGNLGQPDSDRNAYLADLTLSGCDGAGSYEMFAAFTDSDGDELSHIFFNDSFASSDNWTKMQF